MPSTITASYLTRIREQNDTWSLNYIENRGYAPECGDPSCSDDDCALRDREGYDYDGYDTYGYDRSGYDYSGEDRYGNTRCENGDCGCYEHEQPDDERLMNYSYTPTLKFRGKAPYYGMEIEVTTDSIRDVIDAIEGSAPSNLIYCKEDSSVQGLEMVTHPMSFDWAMDNFPWEMLRDIRQTGASVIGEDNGIHIHVGRDGFDNSAHMYRWMKFWYRNPRDIQRIARRRASHWGAFNPDHRKAQKEHVKMGKPSYNFYEDRTQRERYAAINTTNDQTLEVRVFASTLRPQRARAALQLVAGSVEYTRHLSAQDITKRHGWEWAAFMAWAAKQNKYGDLLVEHRLRRYI